MQPLLNYYLKMHIILFLVPTKKIFTILHALNIQKVYTKGGDFEAALKFFNMKQDNSLKIKTDVTQNIEKPASEYNENLFSPILNVFKNMMETSNIIDKYITAIPHLMSIGFTLKKISSPNHVISKFDAIKGTSTYGCCYRRYRKTFNRYN